VGPELRVLLIDNDSKAARRVERALASAGNGSFAVEWVDRLLPGLDRLADGGIDVCLIGLSLDETQGPRTVLAARAQAPDVPVLALAQTPDEEVVRRVLEEGAEECLRTDKLDADVVAAAIRRVAKARARRREPSRELPTREQAVDGLTSLLNERGLLALGERHVEVAVLTRRPFAVLYVDIDGLASVNAGAGTGEGDRVLVGVAGLLTATFRGSDVVARVGGDEFCVLLSVVSPTGASEKKAIVRLEQALEKLNAERDGRPVSLTVGAARFDPETPLPFESLLVRAKHEMRERKRRSA
jgi:diguanylate cyclase (GGDEF)-like protein